MLYCKEKKIAISIMHSDKSDDSDRIERHNSRLFYILLTVPQTVSNTYTQVGRAQSCASDVLRIRRSSHGTWPVPCGMKGQLSC